MSAELSECQQNIRLTDTMTARKEESGNNPELEWMQMQQALQKYEAEDTKGKFLRKIKENPLVPIGCMATVAALSYGLYNFRVGNTRKSQLMMRARVLAQGFTLLAVCGAFATLYK